MSLTSAPPADIRGKALAVLIAAMLTALALPGAANATGSIYWSNHLGAGISHANLDGSGGGADLAIAGALPKSPAGIAIDIAANRIYWAEAAGRIAYANLDGSGRGTLNTGAAPLSQPSGIAIDTISNRLYWANFEGDTISYANLDGTGGGELNTAGAEVNGPVGVAIDIDSNRLFWANSLTGTISYASLGGGGGGILKTTGATVERPTGVAIDPGPIESDALSPDRGRIYWANGEATEGLFYANLNGSGGGKISTAGAAMSSPAGLAIDPGAGRIYWANGGSPGTISYAGIDGTGGGELSTAGAAVAGPEFLALLEAPSGGGGPVLSGQFLIERPLYCSQGSWESDLPGAFLYRAPQSYAYSWLRNGEAIAGETESSYRPRKPGIYDCRVTASNQAGDTAQISEDLNLVRGFARARGVAPVHGRRALLTLSCSGDGRCTGLAKLIAHIGYSRVVHEGGQRKVIRRRALFPIGKARFSIYPGHTKVVAVKLKRKGARILRNRRSHRLWVKLLGRDLDHRSLLLRGR
jgi:DNA-binding beta-propeller fold protein YncE